MSDTIFYTLKLKRTRTPMEVFQKMKKKVKNKGVTQNWTCDIDVENETMTVDFGDGESENFFIKFDKKICDGFCKVYFPLEGELFDDEKKSEFKTLLNMIYSVRTSFSEMQITDDYGLAESFLESKKNKIVYRELTSEELDRAKRLYDEGHTDCKEFVMALLYDYRGLSYSDKYSEYVIKNVPCSCFDLEEGKYLWPFVESFLYETVEYKDKGRLCYIDDYFSELNGTWFAVYAFLIGMDQILKRYDNGGAWDPKSAQTIRLSKNSYLPALEKTNDSYEKCILTYRYFVSILDYLGFKYVGKENKK